MRAQTNVQPPDSRAVGTMLHITVPKQIELPAALQQCRSWGSQTKSPAF